MSYKDYLHKDYRVEFSCPLYGYKTTKCWVCPQFEYCASSRDILAKAQLVHLEYTPTAIPWLLKDPMGLFEHGRFGFADSPGRTYRCTKGDKSG